MADKPRVGAGDTAITRPGTASGARDDELDAGGSRWTLWLIGALVLVVPLIILAVVKLHGPQLERDAYVGLELESRLKAQLVESWLAERRGDSRVIATDAELVERIAAFRRQPDPATEALLRNRLDAVRLGHAYSGIYLLDPQGEVLLGLGGPHEISAQTKALLPIALASGDVEKSEFYIDADDGMAALNFVAPLRRTVRGLPQPVAALVLHAEPDTWFFPTILAWPSASPSGETLLVRRDGDSVVYLNRLRHANNTALTPKRPLAEPFLPAAAAVRDGQTGKIRGRDYRGIEVLAAYRPVAGTDWHLVAKLDYQEVMAPLWELVSWVGLITLTAIVAIAAVLRRLWSQQARLHRLAARARQARALQESEARFRAVTETARDAIVTADAAGNIVGWNAAATRLFGFADDEIIGQPLTRIIPPRYHQRAMEGFFRMMNGDPAQKDGSVAELSGRRKDDSEVLLERTVTLSTTAAGQFYTCTMRDITERKRVEEELRIAAAAFESHQGMVVTDADDVIVRVNAAFTAITGYSAEEAVGRRMNFLKSDRHPAAFYSAMWEHINRNSTWQGEIWNRNKNGEVHPHWLTISAVKNAHGLVTHYVGTYTDITERVRQEQEANKLLKAVEQSQVSILITNRKGVIEYVNPSFTRISGYTREDAIGRTPAMLKSDQTPTDTHRELWRTILGGAAWHGILRNRRKNGELIWEQTSIAPIIDDAGAITHFVAVKEDVTERKRIEAELEEHQAHLEYLVFQRTEELSHALDAAKAADKSKDEFLANITHELRTPLSAVIGFSNLARPFCSDARQRDYLDKVNLAGKTLAGIIDDLLDLSKIAAGRMEFEATPFSLRQLVARSSSVISYQAREKHLELVERIAADVPDVLVGDALRLEQILLNLLANAVKFTAQGRVELRIGLQAHDERERRVCLRIEVEDTGIGLREEEIARLFKPFSQADASMTRRYGGTGLGLAICKRLAELMDGDIAVSSRPGRGSTFVVKLWLKTGTPADLPAMAETRPDLPRPHYEGVCVLVVDDQPFNRDVVEGLLEAVGIAAYVAGDGREALDLLSLGSEVFDLVLMDIQMPIMDGLTATRVIRKLDGFEALPIIAMTAHTMTREREQALAAGMSDHIGKPFDEAGFYHVLAKWIPRHKQRARTSAPSVPTPANALPPLRGVDTRAGLSLLLGDEARYRHWLRDFVKEAPTAMSQLRQALSTGATEAASMAAHALKGRMGLLGMKELAAIAAALETAIDQAAPTRDLLPRLERGVAAMCAEIQGALGAPEGPAAPLDALPEQLPPGPAPEPVARLLAGLRVGDADCDQLVAECLAALRNTAWAPHLRQAMLHIQNFDYAAADRVLSATRQAQAVGG